MPAISPELLKILACPISECRGGFEERGSHLACLRCGRRYRIEGAWPVLIPEEAEPPEASKPG